MGVYNQAILGQWGGFDVVLDPYTQAKNGEVVITINTWWDLAIRHAQAFCVSADAGNQ